MRDLNEIECFVKAVELKSLTAAAKALRGNEGRVAITVKQRAKRRLVALPGIEPGFED